MGVCQYPASAQWQMGYSEAESGERDTPWYWGGDRQNEALNGEQTPDRQRQSGPVNREGYTVGVPEGWGPTKEGGSTNSELDS